MSRVGAVFNGISAKKQPAPPRFFYDPKDLLDPESGISGKTDKAFTIPHRPSGRSLLQNAFDGFSNGIDISHAVERHKLALLAVIVRQRRGLFAIFRQPLTEGFRIVVGTNRAAGGDGFR